jgi:hypothetical protein
MAPVGSCASNPISTAALTCRTRRLLTGRNGDDGRLRFLPVSRGDTNASVRVASHPFPTNVISP